MSHSDLEKYEANPVNLLWDDILFLPVVGMVDSKRAQDIMDVLLEKAEQTAARFAILDIRGVAAVDSAVANHVIKIVKASRMLGCSTILTGVTPAVAQSLVNVGVDLGDILCTARVKDALSLAFRELGIEIRPVASD
ncbi:MAG: STAS domain-containing protein [Zetaproteobacteria bacterium]|nr:MAG: STAS domain-containing protein [Zetaproteobacteria bacterium]